MAEHEVKPAFEDEVTTKNEVCPRIYTIENETLPVSEVGKELCSIQLLR